MIDTIVKVLNEKVADGDAKTIVEALKQIDPNAEGETVAEVLKNMNLGGGGGSSSGIPVCTVTYKFNEGILNPQITFNGVNMLNPYSYALNPEEPYGINPSSFTLDMNPQGTTIQYLYNYIQGAWACVAQSGNYDVDGTEDEVNISDGDIIDPTKDSSYTIRLSSK